MRLDSVTAVIRPRSDWEAVDLGLALVRRDFWRCWAVWWLALALPTAVTGWWLWDNPLLVLMLFWWWKPAGSRLVLFEVSRRLFGERPTWRASLRQIPRAWTRRFGFRFLWARLSPWLPVMLALDDLEGLSGKPYRQRAGQVSRRGESVVMWIYLIADVAGCWFGLAILILVLALIPEGQDGAWRMAVDSWDTHDPTALPLLILRTLTGCVMVAMSLTDVFVTGTGFGIYLNNRTWLEGWDVEMAFKRLARRLTQVALLVLAGCALGLPAMADEGGGGHRPLLQAISDGHRPPLQELQDHAAAPRDVPRWIREVKADEAFKVHTVIDKVAKSTTHEFSWDWWPFGGGSGGVAGLDLVIRGTIVALVLGALLGLLWTYRHVWRRGDPGTGQAAAPPAARVVMGLQVDPHTLPDDVPGAAWALWQSGHPHEALGLLYRASLSRVMQVGRVNIHKSDTEGDCLRRVEQTGAAAHPDYFRGLTRAWSRLAYAGQCPPEREMELLCQQWPFKDRRDG